MLDEMLPPGGYSAACDSDTPLQGTMVALDSVGLWILAGTGEERSGIAPGDDDSDGQTVTRVGSPRAFVESRHCL